MGSLDNEEEEFCWLSHGTGGSDDALKSGFKFSSAEVSPLKSMADYSLGPKENIEGLPINDCNKKASPIDKKLRSQMNVDLDAGPPPLSTFSESNVKSTNTDDLMPNDKVGYAFILIYFPLYSLDSEFLSFKLCSTILCGFYYHTTHGGIYTLTKWPL